MSLNELAKEIHENTKNKGFWTDDRDPLSVLMLIVTEAAEAAEDVRSGQYKLNQEWYLYPGYPESEILSHKMDGLNPKPVGVPSEMADIIIRVLDACAAWKIDIDKAVTEKMEYNKTRAIKHGKIC